MESGWLWPASKCLLRDERLWLMTSSEIVVKVVNTKDMTKVQYLRDQGRAVKHVAFDNSGSRLAVSCTDGNIFMYSLSSEEPNMIRKVDSMIKSLDSDAEASSKVLWHPDGRLFAAPTSGREVQTMSLGDWANQRSFNTDHSAAITAAAWSPNGAVLATTSSDLTLCLWETKTQKLVKKFDDLKATILALAWHPTENILSYTNNDGELFIHTNIIPMEHSSLLQKGVQPAPFFHDPAEGRAGLANGTTLDLPQRPQQRRAGTPDSLDDILGPDSDDGMEGDDFVVDDDGAGYAVNGHGKRPNTHLGLHSPSGKRRAFGSSISFRPQIHEPFQPGSTPWRGNRRYLCLNLTGFVWTVSQETTHNTVTVEFYDRSLHRDFHFTDPFQYDKACLNENGTLFSCQPNKATNSHALVYYRPHETWTTRTDWRTELPLGEEILAIALSERYVVVSTSANYIRIYTLFGVPVRVYRQKISPAVTCAAFRDYVLSIGNGPVSGDGSCNLLYTIENVKRDEVYQSEDILALPPGATLRSVFWSAEGDPYIYDSTGVLLTLLHWRTPGQARWVPMLDTKLLSRLESGGKQESYWPVAVSHNRFHCIILKGQDKYPYFPRSILSEFAFQIPLSSPADKEKDIDELMGDDDDESAARKNSKSEASALSATLILTNTLISQLSSAMEATSHATVSQRQALADLEVSVNKTLLQMLGQECLAGEDHGMKALEVVGLMRDVGGNGKIYELAVKVANRYERYVLAEKIRDFAERKVVGLDREDDDE